MKKVIPFCASLAFLLAVSGGANAGIVADFTNDGTIFPGPGVLAVPDTKLFSLTPSFNSTIDHQLVFQIAAPAFLIAATLVAPKGFLTNTDGSGSPAVVKLFREDSTLGPADPPPVDTGFPFVLAVRTVSVDNLTETYSLSALLSAIVPTRFFIDIQADTGAQGGYQLTLTTLTPVPIPPAAVLFLSALAGLAGFSRIRRRKAVTT